MHTSIAQLWNFPAATVVLQPLNAVAFAQHICISKSAPLARNRGAGARCLEASLLAWHLFRCIAAACSPGEEQARQALIASSA